MICVEKPYATSKYTQETRFGRFFISNYVYIRHYYYDYMWSRNVYDMNSEEFSVTRNRVAFGFYIPIFLLKWLLYVKRPPFLC